MTKSGYPHGGWMPITLALAMLAYLCFPLSAADRGRSTGNLLLMGGNARAYGLGEAYGALPDYRASTFYYNPAAVSAGRHTSIDLLHGPLIDPIFYDSVAGVIPAGSGGLGFGVQYLSYGTLEEIDNTGTKTGSSFAPKETLGRIAYGTVIHQSHLRIGVAAQFLSSKLSATKSTVAGDIGLLYISHDGSLGIAYQNFGNGLKFVKESSPLPTQLRIAGAKEVPNYDGTWISLAATIPNKGDPDFFGGIELHLNAGHETIISPRAGYNTRGLSAELGSNANYSVGLGFEFFNLGVDYAYNPLGDLGNTHRVSLSYKFHHHKRRRDPHVDEDNPSETHKEHEHKHSEHPDIKRQAEPKPQAAPKDVLPEDPENRY
ncbi:MAG: PorV/PorQ family protein [Elusimicrobia bacterium]|nr:PorV/PorQ family protein [Elusimicrobiota bacterium]